MDKKMIYEEYRMLIHQKTQLDMAGRSSYEYNSRIQELQKLLDQCYKETKTEEKTFPEPAESPF